MGAAFLLTISMLLIAPLTQIASRLPFALLTQLSSPPGQAQTLSGLQDTGTRAIRQGSEEK